MARKHLNGAWDRFWIKFLNGTFLALQIKAICPQKFKFHAGVKKCHLAIFQNGLGWLCPVSAVFKNPSQEFKKSCFGCQLFPRKAKLETVHFSKVQSDEITVWTMWNSIINFRWRITFSGRDRFYAKTSLQTRCNTAEVKFEVIFIRFW